jgi:hypothetical protein
MVEKTGNETMKDMPKSVQKWYRLWVGAFPESRHPRDLERFYMFVSILLFTTRKERSRYWLEENLREDSVDPKFITKVRQQP